MTKEAPKPGLGKAVHYYDPNITDRIGRRMGYGGRGAGPYHAVVTNDIGAGVELFVFFPETPGHALQAVSHKDDARPVGKGYWDWTDSMAKARAAKAHAETT